MIRGVLLVFVVFLGGLVACADQQKGDRAVPPQPADPLPTHASELAPLTLDATFPRFHPSEIASAGYPDHMHVYGFPGYNLRVAEDGETYGVYSLARGTKMLPRDGLVTQPGVIWYRRICLTHDPALPPAGVMPAMEVLDWARRELSILLEHDRADTLVVLNPTDLDDYRKRTGFAFHRLYHLEGSVAVIEPASVLFARGLALHAAFHLVASWLVDDLVGGAELPHWLTFGLAAYLAEDGSHYLNFLAMYRPTMPVILGPSETEAILAAGANPDDETDKQQFRIAGYSAFLMVWELVEYRGGWGRVRDFLGRIGRGETVDSVCLDLYGATLDDLAVVLDATSRREPVGDQIQPRKPHRPPTPEAAR